MEEINSTTKWPGDCTSYGTKTKKNIRKTHRRMETKVG